MSTKFIPCSLDSVAKPPTLVLLLPTDGVSWCEQFSQEGYNVIHAVYPPPHDAPFQETLQVLEKEILNIGNDWGLVTYGFHSADARALLQTLALSLADLKASVHFCPSSETGKSFLFKDQEGRHIPTIIHLASSQESLHAALLPQIEPDAFDYVLPTSAQFPVELFTYPLVPANPPFPLLCKPPATLMEGDLSDNVHIRCATGLSLSRTLGLLRRRLGPHFNLERLWEKHTFYEFVERDPAKTMKTMVLAVQKALCINLTLFPEVASPYVNHVATMTGGVGFENLSRFYKYHFTGNNITPPDTEMITVSRTVGVDRIVDEMIFKCTHTTEIDYFLPGIPPTGKPLEIAVVGIIAFRGDKLCFEHLYWDQASALVQLGLLQRGKLPIGGVEVARKVLDPFGQPSNLLLAKWKESEDLSAV